MKAKTTVTKGTITTRKWHLVDLSGQTLGRVATQIAQILIGKANPSFSYNRDDGDYVIAINSDKLIVTGDKGKKKVYQHHTGYAGSLKEFTFDELMAKDSRKVIYKAVYGMVPKNRLRSKRMTRLKIFAGSEHQYADKLSK